MIQSTEYGYLRKLLSEYGEIPDTLAVDQHEHRVMQRLKRAIRKAGGAKIVADHAGIPYGTLTKNLSGDTKIAFETVLKLAHALQLDIGELMTAEISTLDEPIRKAMRAVKLAVREPGEADVHKRLIRIVQLAYKDAGIRATPEDILAEALGLGEIYYTEMHQSRTMEQRQEALMRIHIDLKARLSEAVANPGSGKASA